VFKPERGNVLTRLMLGISLSLAFPSFLSFAADISGHVSKVVDGDTLVVCDDRICEKVRLCGVDAPERGDLASKSATKALSDLVRGRSIWCRPVGEGTVCDGRSKTTSGDRIVASCLRLGKVFWRPLRRIWPCLREVALVSPMSEKRIRELENRVAALEKAVEEIKDATWEPGATLGELRKHIGEILVALRPSFQPD
jgi:hypothetical protein